MRNKTCCSVFPKNLDEMIILNQIPKRKSPKTMF